VFRGSERLRNLLMLTPFVSYLRFTLSQIEVWTLISHIFSSILKENPNIDRIIALNKKGFLYNPWILIKFLVRHMGIGFDLSFDCSR